MHLNAALPDVILATVYQPVQLGIRSKGPDSLSSLAFTALRTPNEDSFIPCIFPP